MAFYLRSVMIKSASFGVGGANKSNCGSGGSGGGVVGFSFRNVIAAGSVFFNQSSLHLQTGHTYTAACGGVPWAIYGVEFGCELQYLTRLFSLACAVNWIPVRLVIAPVRGIGLRCHWDLAANL